MADESLKSGAYVVGANRDGYHLVGVTVGKDFDCEWADLQVALPGEGCPKCGKPLVELILEHTHTCYLGDRVHRHAWGYGCGDCPACKLRARGYAAYRAAEVSHKRG